MPLMTTINAIDGLLSPAEDKAYLRLLPRLLVFLTETSSGEEGILRGKCVHL